MSTTNDATEAIAVITRDQLRGATVELRELADKLDAFRAGDSGAWTDADALNAHGLLYVIQSHVGLTRSLRESKSRRDTVLLLDEYR